MGSLGFDRKVEQIRTVLAWKISIHSDARLTVTSGELFRDCYDSLAPRRLHPRCHP